MPALSTNMDRIEGSRSAAMTSRVAELIRAGKKIIPLQVGEPDFPTPAHICEAGIRAIQNGKTRYTPAAGIYELREAIAQKLRTENKIPAGPENIVVSTGAKEALFCAVMAAAGPGDEVILPVPCYVSYPDIVRFAGARCVFVPTREDYSLNPDAVEAAVTERTKAVILCSPNNPCGSVYAKEDLTRLVDLAEKYDFTILSDEVYEKLVFHGKAHVSPASLSPKAFARTVTINGFSKTYAMTGWRLGYLAAPPKLCQAVLRLQSQITTCQNSISQMAALAALSGPQDAVERMRLAYEERVDLCQQRLLKIPGVRCPGADGAFYLFFDVSAFLSKRCRGKLLESDSDLCLALLSEKGVCTMPGSAYEGPGKIRISCASSREQLTLAMDLIGEFLTAL